jgi:hypothetical protein
MLSLVKILKPKYSGLYIFLIFMKYNYKPENNNMLKHFFKKEELDTLDNIIDKNIIVIDMEEKKKPKRKTPVKKVKITI